MAKFSNASADPVTDRRAELLHKNTDKEMEKVEIYNLVERKGSLGKQFLGAFILALTIMSFLSALFVFLMIIPTVILGCVWYFIFLHYSKEFEYSYFDGEIRFARIMNKSRRKSLYQFSMDDVLQIAPLGDRSVYRYEQDKNVKCKDMSSGYSDAQCYVIVVRQENHEPVMVRFEPDKRLLDAIQQRYPQKLIRLPEPIEDAQDEAEG